MNVTRIGLQIPSFTFANITDLDLFTKVAEIAGVAERAGFDSLWVMDHFYQIPIMAPETEPMFEAYTLLGGIAARTENISLGTLVTGVTYRNPALLAKQVTTLDVISAGRAILGIGAAWHDVEHRGYGFDFPSVKERMDRLEESVQICRLMFTEDRPSFTGRYYTIDEARNIPRPVQKTGIPILIGGSGETRTLALVAKYADACNLFGNRETIRHKIGVLEDHCETIGRDPTEIAKTRLGGLVIASTNAEAEQKAQRLAKVRNMDEDRLRAYATIGDPDAVCEQISGYLDAGLTGMIFNMPDPDDLDILALAGETLAKIIR
ncbi:MAG TPA: LLM class F420-dependent oxidoreductase [Acidimicrobiales bacterium]|nr:LLM class F420-dependent oxidoreductase [Acidimicrobiales bacterium]